MPCAPSLYREGLWCQMGKGEYLPLVRTILLLRASFFGERRPRPTVVEASEKVIPPGGLVARSLGEIIDGQVGVTHDLAKQPAAQITPGVQRHRGTPAVGVLHDDVASALPDLNEPLPFQDGDHLPSREGGKPGTHTETRILAVPTSA